MIGSAHVIGMGRLGRHWANRLESLNITVHRWSRHASEGIRAMENWSAAEPAQAIFLAVPDGEIDSVAGQVVSNTSLDAVLVHHAGAVSIDALPVDPERRAVMWPPMTFIQESPPDWDSMPLGVASKQPQWLELARMIAPQAFSLTAESRPILHMGAVLAGNLSASWLGVVESFLDQHDLPLATLRPLVIESVKLALEGRALDTVSGPASRNDTETLKRQCLMLDGRDADLALLHRILTNRILNHHGHNGLPSIQATPRQD